MNVINESFTEGILIFFYYFTEVLVSRKNTEYLITFYYEVVLNCIINKFQSEIYFGFTTSILDMYLFGILEIIPVKEEIWDVLMKAAKYVVHFERKHIEGYYDTLKCLYKLSLKEKKILFNEREILNFLDNLKMNFPFLSDPSEKKLEEYKFFSWKIKLNENSISQLPKKYFETESPNNLIKYKGLKNMGNSNFYIFIFVLLFIIFVFCVIPK